jgi:hypothetical protein
MCRSPIVTLLPLPGSSIFPSFENTSNITTTMSAGGVCSREDYRSVSALSVTAPAHHFARSPGDDLHVRKDPLPVFAAASQVGEAGQRLSPTRRSPKKSFRTFAEMHAGHQLHPRFWLFCVHGITIVWDGCREIRQMGSKLLPQSRSSDRTWCPGGSITRHYAKRGPAAQKKFSNSAGTCARYITRSRCSACDHRCRACRQHAGGVGGMDHVGFRALFAGSQVCRLEPRQTAARSFVSTASHCCARQRRISSRSLGRNTQMAKVWSTLGDYVRGLDQAGKLVGSE